MEQNRAFIYTRFSTNEQDDGTSQEQQLSACHQYAQSKGQIVVKEFCDMGVSGTIAMENRPQGKLMLKEIDQGNCEHLVIYLPDRANRDMLNAALLRKHLERRGVQFHFTNLGLVKSSNKMLVSMLDMMAEYEIDSIRERTTNGRRDRVKVQKKMVLSAYPYGYDKIGLRKDAYLVINESEAQFVRMAFELYIYKGYTLFGIAQYFNEMNLPTKTGIIPNQTKNGIAWIAKNIHNILKNSLYKGIYTSGKTSFKIKEYDNQPKWERQYKIPEEKWERLEFPELAIVSPDLWEMAQEKLSKNLERSRFVAKNHGAYLLSGFIVCPYCERKMGGYKAKNSFYYVCSNLRCPAHSIGIVQHKLDDVVWNWMTEQVTNPELMNQGIERLFQIRRENMETSLSKQDELKQVLSEISTEMQRYAKAIGKTDDENLIAHYEHEMAILSRQHTAAEKELLALQKLIEQNNATSESKNIMLQMANEFKRRIEYSDQIPVPARRKLLEMLNLEILFFRQEKKYIQIRWGFGPESFVDLETSI